MSSMKELRGDATGKTYADPTDPDSTCRFKQTSAKKSLDGHSVTNQVTEVIYNELNEITIGSSTVSDPISVRVKVSASHHSEARVKEIISAFSGDSATWSTDGVWVGFTPTNPPTVPGSV